VGPVVNGPDYGAVGGLVDGSGSIGAVHRAVRSGVARSPQAHSSSEAVAAVWGDPPCDSKMPKLLGCYWRTRPVQLAEGVAARQLDLAPGEGYYTHAPVAVAVGNQHSFAP
jgi:hypothetical protein